MWDLMVRAEPLKWMCEVLKASSREVLTTYLTIIIAAVMSIHPLSLCHALA